MSESSTSQLLDPSLVERIATLRVRASRAVDGLRSGLHKSPHKGASMIFAEHRDYRPGDDLRMLDWRAYARNDRYTIKRFEQETHLRASLLLDLSASMAYDGGDPKLSKATHAASLLAALGMVLLNQGDSVGAYVFDHEVVGNVPPRSRADHLDALLRLLATPARREPSAERPSLARALASAGERVGRRGIVALASDLLDLDDGALSPLSQLCALGHEVFVLHTMHPHELDFPFRHGVRFEDSETPALLETDADALRQSYLAEVARFVDSCKQRCVAAGARYVFSRTDDRVEETLGRLLRPSARGPWA